MKQWYKLIIKKICISICCAILHGISFAGPGTEGIQVYQKNMHLFEEHKQMLAADIYRYYNADNIWDELRHEFVLPHYEDNYRVQEQIEWFLNHQDFLMNSAVRAAPYLYYISQQVRKRHLPAEFVLLPIMESSYNPFAYSSMGAAGIWQIMPGTASGFGIKQDWWYDGRRDIVASTRVALDYLAYLGNFFEGNWLLAIAAYDTGEGNVLSGIRKNIRDGKNTDYWSLPLAQEAKIYVPRLLALAVIISHPERYSLKFPSVRNAPYLAQVDIGGQIDLKHAASLAGLSLKELMHLNPGYNRSATDPHGPFKIVLPIENVQQFAENLAHSSLYQRTHLIRYKIRQGDTLFSIARRFKTSPTTLRKANPILASNLKPGHHLVIPNSAQELSKSILATQQSYFRADNTTKSTKQNKLLTLKQTNPIKPITLALEKFKGKYKLQSGDTLYMVRHGDDLHKISKRFHVSTDTLIAVNKLNHKSVRPGDKLIIPTHLAKVNSTKNYKLSGGDTIYMVRRGDSIEKIAKKFHISPSAIRLANLLQTNHLQEGDHLVIPTHVG